MKNAAQNVAQGVALDVTQDVAEGVTGATEDGSVKVPILPIAIFQRRRTDLSRPYPMGTRRWLASGA